MTEAVSDHDRACWFVMVLPTDRVTPREVCVDCETLSPSPVWSVSALDTVAICDRVALTEQVLLRERPWLSPSVRAIESVWMIEVVRASPRATLLERLCATPRVTEFEDVRITDLPDERELVRLLASVREEVSVAALPVEDEYPELVVVAAPPGPLVVDTPALPVAVMPTDRIWEEPCVAEVPAVLLVPVVRDRPRARDVPRETARLSVVETPSVTV